MLSDAERFSFAHSVENMVNLLLQGEQLFQVVKIDFVCFHLNFKTTFPNSICFCHAMFYCMHVLYCVKFESDICLRKFDFWECN